MIKIAIIGYGIIGSSVAEILREHKTSIGKKANQIISIKYILDIKDFKEDKNKEKIIKDFNTIINDSEIKIVVETIGGVTSAYEYVKKSLLNGKSVVTSNKELVAKKGQELLKIASYNNASFLFEATVGAGIPIVHTLTQCLVANDVLEVGGILNGTTNFILTKMFEENLTLEEALQITKDLQYTEKNSEDDIEGRDTCRKICILSSIVFGKHIYPRDVHTVGISNITQEDINFVKSCGATIKLLGQASMMENGRIQIAVEPMLVLKQSRIYTVNGVFNSIVIKGDSTGDIMFYGKGTGKLPIASAIVTDIIECVKHIDSREHLYWKPAEVGYVMAYKNTISSAFVRIKFSENKAKIINKIQKSFSNVKILEYKGNNNDEMGFITDCMTIGKINSILNNLSQEKIEVKSVIRISNL